jgi:hypothetical protein
MSETKALAAKLVAAMKEIDAVGKGGKNEKQNYQYVRAVDVAKEVRPVLIAHGIGFSYSVISSERWEKPTQSGGSLFFVEIHVLLTFTDSETGESVTVQGLGWGMDTGDKAPYKAMTGALKYGLRMNFIIPDELDPENDTRKPSVQTLPPGGGAVGTWGDDGPLFDENGDIVEASPVKKTVAAKTPTVDSGPQISQKQAALIYAVGVKNKGRAELLNWLGGNGWEKTDEIPAVRFDEAKKWAGVVDRPR